MYVCPEDLRPDDKHVFAHSARHAHYAEPSRSQIGEGAVDHPADGAAVLRPSPARGRPRSPRGR